MILFKSQIDIMNTDQQAQIENTCSFNLAAEQVMFYML